MSNPKFILGYTDTETVKLGCDNTLFKQAKYWALRTTKEFKLEGFVILKSSQNNYHVVFNRTVSWSENAHIASWVALLSHNVKLEKWLLMQLIKEESTLRVSPKGDKPSPRVVFRYGKQDKEIKNFLAYRRQIKYLMTHLKLQRQ